MSSKPHHPTLYFGYGSNLNARDLAAWCARHGLDPGGIQPLGPAWLLDHVVGFTVDSLGRKGGVLDVLPHDGGVVPGALFRIDVDLGGWHVLDRKEDLGDKYDRHHATVHDARGDTHAVQTYSVVAAKRRPHVTPHDDYLNVVCEGLAAFGHPDTHVRAAARGERHILPRPGFRGRS